MAIIVDKRKAERILSQAFGAQCTKNDSVTADIKLVVAGRHLTYRYILFTGLLAKATNSSVNPVVLQAQSSLDGAYDARSLCHDVLVPFERTHLQGAIGGSNEPFLNKPARYTELSASNAVRAGNDTILRDLTIKILTSIDSAEEALEYLTCALFCLQERVDKSNQLKSVVVNHELTLTEVYNFIESVISKSFEGETCALIVGALETLYYEKMTGDYAVVAHKVNQSGASSKETGDIDVFRNGSILCAIEVKDKNFTIHDIEHAFRKMIESGASKGEFIYGINAEFDADVVFEFLAKSESNGFYVLFHSIMTYAKMMLYKIDIEDKADFVRALFKTEQEIKAKDATLEWLQENMQAMGWRTA